MVLVVFQISDKRILSCSVRSIVALNLHNYGSGRNPWGNLKPEYLEKVWSILTRCTDVFLHANASPVSVCSVAGIG